MKLLLLLVSSVWADEPQPVDLNALGMSDFNPYLFDREPLWILLPLISLFLVVLHLKLYRPFGPQGPEKQL